MTRRRPLPAAAAVASLLLGASCGGVSYTLRKGGEAPATIAVLPFAGSADDATREAARALLHSRLTNRGYRLVEMAWVDRVLSERGWLRDTANFAVDTLPLPEVITALGVDAVALARDVDESRFNLLILRRHAFGGLVSLQQADGVWWSADHSAGSFGGFLLTSGQVFEELRAQGNHGTPMATLNLVDEFVSDIVDTVPARMPMVERERDPVVSDVRVDRQTTADGVRVIVEGQVTPGCSVCVDLTPELIGVPLVALRGEPGRYRGAHDLPRDTVLSSVGVRARTPFGHEVRIEVKP